MMDTIEDFRKQLRNALNHLYDPDYLRDSPLISLIHLPPGFDAPIALQRLLEEAIEGLRPGPDVPINSQPWHTYDILVSRYIHQLSQEEVANQIGVSLRQLVREQDAAVNGLASKLWNDYLAVGDPSSAVAVSHIEPASSAMEDLSWLKDTSLEQPLNMLAETHVVLDLLNPLVVRYQVNIDLSVEEELQEVAVHPVAFRQALLSILSMALKRANSGKVRIIINRLSGQEAGIIIEGKGNRLFFQLNEESSPEELAFVKSMISMMGGRLEVGASGEQFSILLALPAMQPIKILAIDDNEDFLDLFQRYTSGTRFTVIGTRKPEEIYPLIEKHSPRGIILDVMMPEMDGWQILSRLRRHPTAREIPIFICSIVSSEELAYTLGASGYIRKPVSRESLLKALEEIAANGESTVG